MTRFSVAFLITFFFGLYIAVAQVSADCANAIPICSNTPINGGTNGYGVDDFNGASISGCIKQGSGTIESNSAWYRFKTGESGELGINIGFDVSEDWDFALYKTDGCNNLGEPVRCNYFDNSDNNTYTGFGEDPTGVDNFQYDDYLQVSPGEEYYLFINNYSNNNSGFSIQFSGTIFVEFPYTALDCSIVDNLLGAPMAVCGGDSVELNATTADAVGYEWYMDTGSGYQRLLSENGPTLQPMVSAMYRVVVLVPSGLNLVSDVQVAFSKMPITESVSDEWVCLDGDIFDLSAKAEEALGGQSPDDYRISFHRTMLDAINGIDPLPNNYVPNSASQTIYIRTTSLENTNCFDASESFTIYGVATPELRFPTEIYICEDVPMATIGQEISNNGYDYSWSTGETSSQITIDQAGVYTLTVVNAQSAISCMAERSVTVVFSKPPVISNVEIKYADDDNTVTILTEESGYYEYQLDDGTPQDQPVFYNLFPGIHTVSVTDLNGCGTDVEELVIVGFPKFFTPNGDGVNDTWKVGGLAVLEDPEVTIYDRYGKLLYQMRGDGPGWDGTFNGVPMPSADYWFKLSYTDADGLTKIAKYINSHFSIKR
ncbi:T9SS type B sorting domain-containing protein [Maribacter sp. MMG018]|uniref:T9SS type B sorting domain-containing protein n=1 Tax=Maribacter sp. MMG018 TaxID=2822688 RepID=UPI001B3763B8|nr:T9SS type B sorting domain-containing protein [Maribacter sp. MMG018]MBQ4914296.1 T9SS type B sorting domain-containing protein [Maribacter sp. MMG018]